MHFNFHSMLTSTFSSYSRNTFFIIVYVFISYLSLLKYYIWPSLFHFVIVLKMNYCEANFIIILLYSKSHSEIRSASLNPKIQKTINSAYGISLCHNKGSAYVTVTTYYFCRHKFTASLSLGLAFCLKDMIIKWTRRELTTITSS